MTVKAVKKFIKSSSQDWSGIYIKNISSTISSTPDPRDQQNMYSNTEVRIIRNDIRDNIKGSPGYEGWDREYVGENELKMIYYFADRVSANTFIHASPVPNVNVKVTYINTVLKQKPTGYTLKWFIVDENGQEEEITINNG
jgi:hypothetical protein